MAGAHRNGERGALAADHITLRMLARATGGLHEREWDIPPHMRADAVRVCADIIADAGQSWKAKVLAVRTLALLDALNIRREGNDITERGNELSAAVEARKALLANPEALAALSRSVCTDPIPVEQVMADPPAPPPPDCPPGADHYGYGEERG